MHLTCTCNCYLINYSVKIHKNGRLSPKALLKSYQREQLLTNSFVRILYVVLQIEIACAPRSPVACEDCALISRTDSSDKLWKVSEFAAC